MTGFERVSPARAEHPLVPDQALAWLLHPVTVVALAVLILNDHMLKAAAPGLVTGKLSDVAGLALTPPAITAALALLIPRLPVRVVAAVAVLTVGVGFALVKATAAGAAVATSAWSWASGPSTVLRDRTDLVALPALALSWWAFTHARRHPLPRRAVSLVCTAIVLPTAGLAILATSAGDYPWASEVIVRDGSAFVMITGSYEPSDAVITTDGENWHDATTSEARKLPLAAQVTPPLPGPAKMACAPGDTRHCYRTAGRRMAIEQTDDGGTTWTDAWSVSPGRQRFLSRAYLEHSVSNSDVVPQSVGVLGVGDQYVVLVAAGRDGILVRHPDGRWERLGFPTAKSRAIGLGAPSPPPGLTEPGQRIAAECVYVALALSIGLLLGGLAASSRGQRVWWAVPVTTVTFVYYVGQASVMGSVIGVTSVLAAVALIAFGLLAWVIIVHAARALSLARAAVLTGTLAIALAVAMYPFVEWSSGQFDSYEAAVRSAKQFVVGGIIVLTLVGLAFRIRDRGRPPEIPVREPDRPAPSWPTSGW